jgi:hypothetical protein
MRMRTGVAVTVAGGAVAISLLGTSLALASQHPSQLRATVRGSVNTPNGRLPHAFLTLSTWPDSLAGEHGADGGARPEWVRCDPTTNLEVPAHSEVTITIDQYDSGETIYNPYFAQPHGTVGGTETVNGKTVTKVDPTAIGHTFTLHMFPANANDEIFAIMGARRCPAPDVPAGSSREQQP